MFNKVIAPSSPSNVWVKKWKLRFKNFFILSKQILLEPESLLPISPSEVSILEKSIDNQKQISNHQCLFILGFAMLSFATGNEILSKQHSKTFFFNILLYTFFLLVFYSQLGRLFVSYFCFNLQEKFQINQLYSIKTKQIWELSFYPFIFWTPICLLAKVFFIASDFFFLFLFFSFLWITFWCINIFIRSLQGFSQLSFKKIFHIFYKSLFFLLFLPSFCLLFSMLHFLKFLMFK